MKCIVHRFRNCAPVGAQNKMLILNAASILEPARLMKLVEGK